MSAGAEGRDAQSRSSCADHKTEPSESREFAGRPADLYLRASAPYSCVLLPVGTQLSQNLLKSNWLNDDPTLLGTGPFTFLLYPSISGGK